MQWSDHDCLWHEFRRHSPRFVDQRKRGLGKELPDSFIELPDEIRTWTPGANEPRDIVSQSLRKGVRPRGGEGEGTVYDVE